MDTCLLRGIRCLNAIDDRVEQLIPGRTLRFLPPPPLRRLFISSPFMGALAILLKAQVTQLPDPSFKSGMIFITNGSHKEREVISFLSEVADLNRSLCTYTYKPDRNALMQSQKVQQIGKMARRLLRLSKYIPAKHLYNTLRFLITYSDISGIFARRQPRPAFVLCVTDLSPTRIAAAVAARKHGIETMYCQHNDVLPQVPPFPCDALVLANPESYAACKATLAHGGSVFQKPASPVPFIKQVPEPFTSIGVALNNFYDPQPCEKLLQGIRYFYPEADIRIRFHPNDTNRAIKPAERVHICPADQTIEDFAASCQLVTVANSAIQIDLLKMGVPVVLMPLDEHPFDIYGYAARGLVYACDHLAGLEAGKINTFYRSNAWHKAAQTHLQAQKIQEAQGTQELEEWIMRRVAPNTCFLREIVKKRA